MGRARRGPGVRGAEGSLPLRVFVRGQVAERLDRVETEIDRSLANPDAEAIHDLRVSIRRLTEALRTFEPLLDREPVRKPLRRIMRACSDVRDRDIALELGAASGLPTTSGLWKRIEEDRALAAQILLRLLAEHRQHRSVAAWRTALHLDAAAEPTREPILPAQPKGPQQAVEAPREAAVSVG